MADFDFSPLDIEELDGVNGGAGGCGGPTQPRTPLPHPTPRDPIAPPHGSLP